VANWPPQRPCCRFVMIDTLLAEPILPVRGRTLSEASVDLKTTPVAGQQALPDRSRPFLQGLRSKVCWCKPATGVIDQAFHSRWLLIEQQPHQLGDGRSRDGVVKTATAQCRKFR